jgi:YfiR/HmsC-like
LRRYITLFVLFVLSVTLVTWCARDVQAQDTPTVRLGFVLNFARYVEWPEATLKPGEPMYICLAPGDAAMVEKLGELAKQTVQNRQVQVKSLMQPSDMDNCKILYLPAELPTPLAAWLTAASKTRALTVSDLPDFADQGGMIGLVSVNGRYRFDVNLGNARQANLRISAYLFKLARTVK